MESAAQDEDVVIENSSLYKHLESVGFLDPADENTASGSDEQPVVKNTNTDTTNARSQGFRSRMTNWLKSVLLVDTDNELRGQLSKSVRAKVTECSTLEEDDRAAIISYCQVPGSCEPDRSSQPDINRLWCLMAVLSSYALSRLVLVSLGPYDPPAIFDFLVISLAVVLAVYCCLRYARYYRKKQACVGLLGMVDQLVGDMDRLCGLATKSVRHIQESELIARGFFLAKPANPICQLELSRHRVTQRQCPNLRKVLFYITRECLLEVKQATSDLITVLPLLLGGDSIGHYVSEIPLSDYGPCLTEEDDGRLKEVSDSYSVSALKAMSRLCRIHFSELLRRLVFSSRTDSLHQQPFFEKFLNRTPWILKKSSDVVSAGLIVLQKQYDSHQTHPQPDSQLARRTAEPCKPFEAVQVAVHSLGLHLQSAVSRINDLEDVLERCVWDEGSDPGAGFTPTLEDGMTRAGQELDACKACLEEAWDRVHRLSANHEDTTKSPSRTPVEASSPMSDESKTTVRDVTFDPSLVEDQVFEAYTDPDDLDLSADSPTSIEDQEARRKMQREAVRLLQELKAVISVRARDTKLREERALAFQTKNAGKTIDELSPLEPLPSCNPRDSSRANVSESNTRDDDTEPDLGPDIGQDFGPGTGARGSSFLANVAAQAARRSQSYHVTEEHFGGDEGD